MVGKNNKFLKENKNNQRFLRFSLRKLSVGVVSVAIAAGFYIGGSQSVLADTTSTVPVVSQSTSNDNLAENTDKNTVNLQNSSASADSSAVASAADSTAAEAVKSAPQLLSNRRRLCLTLLRQSQQPVAEAKPAAASNTANLLDNKAQSNAASDSSAKPSDDDLLKNIKTYDPDNATFNKYQTLVNTYKKETTDTSSQYVFSVINDDRIDTDFIWTIDRNTGSKVSVYLADRHSRSWDKQEEITSYHHFASEGGNFNVTSILSKDVILNYTPKNSSASIDVVDPNGLYLKTIYELSDTDDNFYSSITEIVPAKSQPVIKFLYKDPSTGKLLDLREPIYDLNGLTGKRFVLDTSSKAYDYYKSKDKEAFDGFDFVGVIGNQQGTFTQFAQGKTYVKHYADNDLEITYHQIDAEGTMHISYSSNGKQYTPVITKDGKVYSFKDGEQYFIHGELYYTEDGSLYLIDEDGEQHPIEDNKHALEAYSLKAGHSLRASDTLMIFNPFVAGDHAYEFIYVPHSELHQTITRTINITKPGQKTQTITQTAKIYRDATVDDVTGEVTYGAWSTDDTDWSSVDVPAVPGYTIHQSDGKTGIPAVTVTDDQKDVTINVTYTANDQSMNINYVDENGKTVKTDKVNGQTGETVKIPVSVPDHYVLAPSQNIPTDVKLTDNNPAITVKVTPKMNPITDPTKLTKTISRKITINKPGEKPQVITQTATFKRTGKINEVNGTPIYTPWVLDQNGLTTVSAPEVAGYTPSQKTVEGIDNPEVDTKLNDVVINYTANAQTQVINYVDENGKTVKTDKVNGQTGETVKIPVSVPDHYVLAPGQNIPTDVKLTDNNPAITVKVTPKMNPITDPTKLTKTISRKITINKPGEKPQVITQTATFKRTGKINEVNGTPIYTPWVLDQNGLTTVSAPEVAGYTPSQKTVEGIDNPEVDTKLNDVVINYTANAQTQVINYVDENGKTVKTDKVNGQTGETVKIPVSVPDHYVLAPGQNIPTDVKLTDNNPAITVKVTPKMNPITDPTKLTKTISRKITINKPGEKPQVITQTATFKRTGKINEVNGTPIYTPWVLDQNGLTTVSAPEVAGYTPSQKMVEGIDNPEVDTKLNDVVINYTANAQTQVINYVDENGKTVKTDKVNGQTGETVKIPVSVPNHYVLAPGQNIPTDVKLTDNNPAITVKVTPKMNPITDPTKLTKTISRKITINKPGEKPQVITQTATFKRTGKINEVNGTPIYTPWVLDQNGLTTVSAPEVAGYTPSQKTVAAIDNPTANTKLNDVNIIYTANDQTTHINYVDKDGKTIKSDTVSGKTDQNVKTNSEVPAGWKIIDGQVPEMIHFKGEGTPDTTITIEHDTTSVDHTKPIKQDDKTPSGKEIKGAHESDLNQTITRTINVTTPDGQTTTTKQVAKIYRNATIDDVTGEVTYSDWSEGTWADFTPGPVAGYTASPADVPAVTVDGETTDQTVNISYTANDQSMNINYVDDQGNVIANFSVGGKTGQTVDTKAKIPAGWVLEDGQTDAPKTIAFTGAHTDDITIKIEHGKTSVDHNHPVKPGEKTPSGKEIKGAHDEDLNQTITRTIKITEPGKATKTTTQVAHIYRDATVDDVTGDVTYGAWSTDAADWVAVDVPVHAGYTASQADVPAVTVKDGQKDVNIDVTYTPDEQKGQITYVDEKRNQISSTPLTGKTDENIAINPVAPAGWELVPGQKYPVTVTATADGIPGVTLTVRHHMINVVPGDVPTPGDKKPGNNDKKPGDGTPNKDITHEDLNKTITRTFIVKAPTGTMTKTQHISYQRTATIDDVTGDVTFSDWNTDGASFKAEVIPAISGYTSHVTEGNYGAYAPSQDQINNWTDPMITVTYTANDQSQVINYVDDHNKTIKTDTVHGETHETVNVTPSVPDHYELVPGQNIPSEVTLKDKNTPIIVKVQPKVDSITDPAKLNKSISRTITINKPGEKPQVINQHADFTRTGQYNEVTGATVYTDWTLKGNTLEAVDAPAVPGYTPNVAHVDSVENPTADTKLANVVINYSADDQTQKIDYVDPNGKVVKTDTVKGKTDETVKVTPNVPDHYELVPGQEIPGEVKITDDNPAITVKVTPKLDPVTDPAKLNKSISRTITINKPGEKPQVINQHADFTRTGQYNEVTGATVYIDWTLKDSTLEAVDAPAVPGYTPNVAHVDSVENPTADTKLANVVINYSADDQTQKIDYVDPNGKVVKTDTVKGKTDETVKVTPNVPDHYELVPGQEIPGEVKITDDNPAITVKVTPKLDPVTDPAKLNKSISRTITINKPGEKPQVINQTATFKRTGKTNEVTGITTYTPWVLVQNGLTTVSAPAVPGYTPSQKTVASVDNPTANTKLTDVTINYTANSQTTHINYVDKDGETVKSDTVSGKTDETVKTNSEVPAGWKITDGQIPETIHFTGEETPDTTITIEHDTTSVDHIKPVKPGDKTPSGKVIDGAHESDLNQTITRTINVTTPDGQTTTTKQVAKIFRDATIDDVTGEVTYGSWSEDTWADFKPGQLAGYTASQADVPAVTVKDGQKDQKVDITYTANEGTVLIKYVDRDGNEIGQQVITGHVDDTIKVTPQFPENWVPVDPDTVPAEVQIKEENGQIIIVVVRHDEKDPVQTKKVTRTIMVTTPDGQTKTIKQVVTISRHGNLDLVTGQIAWQPWTTAQWDVFKPAAIAGYIPSLAEVPAVTVDGETTDQTVDITYAAVATPAQPEHQAPTVSDTPDAQQATNQKADSNAQPAVTVVTSQQTATAQQAESTTNSRRLPQTGNSHDASALAGLGLASLMGLLGLGGKRRKRD